MRLAAVLGACRCSRPAVGPRLRHEWAADVGAHGRLAPRYSDGAGTFIAWTFIAWLFTDWFTHHPKSSSASGPYDPPVSPLAPYTPPVCTTCPEEN